jgi:hypothetical protein
VTDLPSDDPDGGDGIAADDAGGSALGRHVGGSGPADVAADDAGVTAGLLRRPEQRGG